jgi:ribosomal protein L37AE/L43A
LIRTRRPKKWCPLCRDYPTEQLGDSIYKCIKCGYTINEALGQANYHRQVLVAKQSIIGQRIQKRHFIKDEDIPSRSEHIRQIHKELESGKRYDAQSMYNPNNKLMPGKVSNTDLWMSAQYCNLYTDAVTPEKEESLHKTLKTRKYQY